MGEYSAAGIPNDFDEIPLMHDGEGYEVIDPAFERAYGVFCALRQSVIWYDIGGTQWRLEDMEPSHRYNTLWFLRKRATSLLRNFRYAAERLYETYDLPSDAHAEDWLETMPLVVRLQELVEKDWGMR